jgi:hypothetical protein
MTTRKQLQEEKQKQTQIPFGDDNKKATAKQHQQTATG